MHTYNKHSHTLSGTSSQEGAPDLLLVLLPALFPAGQGYWQSHLALPHQWPKPGPPSSLHWLPIKKKYNRDRGREAKGERTDAKDREIEHKEGVLQGEREEKERSF